MYEYVNITFYMSNKDGSGVLRGEDLYHTGLVVDDLDQSLEIIAARAGHRFARPLSTQARLRTPAGESTVPLRFTYSQGPGPLVELIQAVPGTHWQPVAGSGLHHLGYWADDVEAESAALADAGLPLEAAGLGPAGQVLWAYHYAHGAVRVELVARATKPFIDALVKGE